MKQRYAKAGEQTSAKAFSKLDKALHGYLSKGGREAATIQPKTDAKEGRWICADCGEVFQNNAMSQSHFKSHRLAWWTGTQIEEP